MLTATKFIMAFNRSAQCNGNLILRVYEHERLMWCTDAPNEYSCHIARASSYILEQEAEIVDAWTRALEDRDCKDVANVNKDIKVEVEESELHLERTDITQYLTQNFVTLSEVQNMIAAGMGRSKSYYNHPALARLVEDMIIEMLQLRYYTGKDGENSFA